MIKYTICLNERCSNYRFGKYETRWHEYLKYKYCPSCGFRLKEEIFKIKK